MTLADGAAVFAGGFVASAINAIAGGGTLVSFPTLLAVGCPPRIAAATNAMGLLPGPLASVFGYRSHVRRDTATPALLVPTLAGAVLGAVLLLLTPSVTFAGIVPYLLITATVLLLLPDDVVAPQASAMNPMRRRLGSALLLAAGIYGGYFGAGFGVLLLPILGMAGVSDLHERNGIKNLISALSTAMVAALFASQGAVRWPEALIMGAGSIAGGYAGAHLAQRLRRGRVRAAIIVIGLVLTVWYLTHPIAL